jgi:serine/threonine protein kinase
VEFEEVADIVGPECEGSMTEQPTIISSRPPIAADYVSEFAHRILLGRIVPGDHLGHFELVQYVGGGGMGRVYRALDARLARSVALKILPPEQAADRDSLLRFQNEAQSAARLDHDNIARVFYVGEDHGLHYIVFEFIEGMNIRELVESRGPLPLEEAISYALQVADALAHAAGRHVVHRDIKPSNLLITPEGQVKLIDMGLARLREADGLTSDLTASGVTLGTFDYISPEQARDPRNADVRSDIYSLGCTLFYMLTGQPPFPEGTVLQKLLQHQGDQPPDPREFRPELSETVTRVLRKMLAKDPRRRYATPAELIEELLALGEEIGLQPPGPGSRVWHAPLQPPVSLVRRHLPWAAPVAALVGIVLALDLFWKYSANQETQVPPPPVIGVEEHAGELTDPLEIESWDDDEAIPSPPSDHATEGAKSAAPSTPALPAPLPKDPPNNPGNAVRPEHSTDRSSTDLGRG